MRHFRWIALVVLVTSLSGCGQKGALVRPGPSTRSSVPAGSPPSPEATP